MKFLGRTLSIITLIALMISSLCITAFSAHDIIANGDLFTGVTWTLDSEGTLTFSGNGPVRNLDYVFEQPWFAYRTDIKSAVFEDGVTHIGNQTLFACENLESVYISKTVESIGHMAFSICIALENVTVHEENPYIYADEQGVIFTKDASTLLLAPGGLKGSYTVPESVEHIDQYSFYYCKNLTEITVPNSVKLIGTDAFSWCKSLQKITLPRNITYIPYDAFAYCINLTDIIIPSTVTSIRDGAFDHCMSLQEINIPDGVTYIGNDAFTYCSSLKSISLPEGLTSLGNKAFLRCENMTDISLPSSLKTMGYSTFYGCSSLESIILPDSLTEIPDRCFGWCSSLQELRIPRDVEKIGVDAFHMIGCTVTHTADTAATVTESAKMNALNIVDISKLVRRGEYNECYDLNNDGKLNSLDKVEMTKLIKGEK